MTCCLCATENTETIIDYGPQPICNRFSSVSNKRQTTIPLAVEQCRTCGLLQLQQPAQAELIRPEVDWIIYNEAEGHLDDAVDQLLKTLSLSPDASIFGISYKDSSTVARIAARGFSNTHVLDPEKDLDISSPCAGIETIQAQLTPERAKCLRETYGEADVLIVRHILEHTHQPQEFIRATKMLLKKDGVMLLEVPDFSTSLKAHDYCNVWEEHIAYYTPSTFERAMPLLGLSSESFLTYQYPLENALLCVARQMPEPLPAVNIPSPDELEMALSYGRTFPAMKQRIQEYLAERTAAGKKTALFGAGHLACKFINFFDLKEHICFIADDHPNKKGCYMPGSNLPILGSAELITQQIGLTLLSLSPESEMNVRARQGAYLNGGGAFASIFPAATSFFLNKEKSA